MSGENEYEREYWPMLSETIGILLVNVPGKYIQLSYEQMYR